MTARTFVVGLVFALLLQLAGTRWIPGFPLAVDMLVILAIFVGLEGRTLPGMLAGLCCGLSYDVLSGGLFGLFGFADTLTGYGTAMVAQRLATQGSGGVFVVFLFAASLQRATLFLLDWALQAGTGIPSWPAALLPVVVTAVLGVMLHAATRGWRRKAEERRLRKTPKLKLDR